MATRPSKAFHLDNYKDKDPMVLIKNCRSFSDLYEIIHSNIFEQLNAQDHLNKIFNIWAQFWKEAQSKSKTSQPSAEIKLIKEALEGETYKKLIKKFSAELPKLQGQGQGLTIIANAISNLLITKESLELLINIAQKINGFRSFERLSPSSLTLLANAVTKVIPEEPVTKPLVEKIADFIEDSSLKGYDPQHLAMIANAVSKVIPEKTVSQDLIKSIAQEIDDLSSLRDFGSQNFALIVNAFAQVLPKSKKVQKAIIKIAEYIYDHDSLKKENYNWPDIALIANALLQVIPDEDISQKLMKDIAKHICKFDSSEDPSVGNLIMILNAIYHISPKEENCKDAIKKIAEHVLRHGSLTDYEPQQICILANVVSKMLPESKVSQDLIEKIAKYIVGLDSFEGWSERAFATIAQAVARVSPKAEASHDLIKKIAIHIVNQPLKGSMRDLSLLANAAAKIAPETEESRNLIGKIATYIVDLKSFEDEDHDGELLALMMNAVSKVLPNDRISYELIEKIAAYIDDLPSLKDYEPQGLALIMNAISNVAPKSKVCIDLIKKISKHIVNQSLEDEDYEPQSLAMIASAVARVLSPQAFPNNIESRQLIEKIARHINELPHSMTDYKPQLLSMIANAIAQVYPESKVCKKLIEKIGNHVYESDSLNDYDPESLAKIANAVADVLPETESSQKLIKKIANYYLDSLEDYSSQDIAMIAYAAAKVGLKDEQLFKKLWTIIKHKIKPYQQEETSISQIYQFYLYARCQGFMLDVDEHYLRRCEAVLKRCKTLPPSKLQKTVSNALQKWLEKSAFNLQLENDYSAVGSQVDIVLLSPPSAASKVKIAIEVDGPFHFEMDTKKLKHGSRFKAMLLEKAEGWKVIRLPYFELDPIVDNSEELEKYLSERVSCAMAGKSSLSDVKEYHEVLAVNSYANQSRKRKPSEVNQTGVMKHQRSPENLVTERPKTGVELELEVDKFLAEVESSNASLPSESSGLSSSSVTLSSGGYNGAFDFPNQPLIPAYRAYTGQQKQAESLRSESPKSAFSEDPTRTAHLESEMERYLAEINAPK